MMKNQFAKRNISFKKLVYLLAAVGVLAIALAAMLFTRAQSSAVAESSSTVTIHVYDSLSQYDKIAGWFWVKGGSGKEHTISASPAADEQFAKTTVTDGVSTTNKAHTFTAEFSEGQTTQLKNGTPLGMLVCNSKGASEGDFWNRYEKETPDVFVDISKAFDANNHADVYYVRKDNVAYTDIEEAKMALDKVTSARFVTKTSTSVTVAFEATATLRANVIAKIMNGETEVARARISVNSSNKFAGTAVFTALNSSNFDFTADYVLVVDGIPSGGASIVKTALIDDAEFIRTYESADTQDLEFGAVYTPAKTTLRVWAPFATAVTANLYDDGLTGSATQRLEMTKRMPASGNWGGVWELELNGDCNGKYYTYTVNNYGAETETIDPYAKACGVNGNRGMIVDLDSTDPAGWANDKPLSVTNAINADTPIVWEVTVKDFSSSADSGMKYKGKYLAFTEQNTTVPGTSLKTGINYLKDLGITYVHLNPVYDFATVDETELSKADNTKDSFNWGYDPQNYNIPEGSYSTDPYNGAVRINEFKRMVMALHEAGIGVIMDVVYNHTYSTSGQALHDTVPYYYHRTDVNGAFTDASGCGNETASERTMMRKYMVDSLVYWAKEYHVDGFRFDLMGIHDLTTISAIRTALDNLDIENNGGRKLLMYGEPWSADGTYTPASYTKRVNATRTGTAGVTGQAINPTNNKLVKMMFAGNGYARNMTELPDRVAVFNDTGREGLRGNNDPGHGWVNGNPGGVGGVMKMIEGGAGSSGSGMTTGAGSRNVAYAAAHDNYTLWDQIVGARHGERTALEYDVADPTNIKRCKMAGAAYLTSTGISFMLAGEEMGRTKYGNENSYNSPSKLNQITWSRQREFSSLYNFYKDLIGLRKQYSSQLFSYGKSTSASFCYGNFGNNVTDYETGHFEFTRTQGGATLRLNFTATTLTGTITIGTRTITI